MRTVSVDAEQAFSEALDREDWEAALDWLMTTYGRAVYRFCYSLVRDAGWSDECQQLTFI